MFCVLAASAVTMVEPDEEADEEEFMCAPGGWRNVQRLVPVPWAEESVCHIKSQWMKADSHKASGC